MISWRIISRRRLEAMLSMHDGALNDGSSLLADRAPALDHQAAACHDCDPAEQEHEAEWLRERLCLVGGEQSGEGHVLLGDHHHQVPGIGSAKSREQEEGSQKCGHEQEGPAEYGTQRKAEKHEEDRR